MLIPECWRRDHRWHFVYIVFDALGSCLYVGSTSQLEYRWKQHRRRRPDMVRQAAAFRVMGPYTGQVVRLVEIQQQVIRQPIFESITRRYGHRDVRAALEAMAAAA